MVMSLWPGFFGPPWSAPCISETEMLCCGHGGIYNNYDNIYGAVITTKVNARVHLILSMNADWAPVGRQPSDQANRLACKSAENWQLPSTSVITIVIITQPDTHFTVPWRVEGCHLGTAVNWFAARAHVRLYISGCRDKHNWPRRDPNLGLLTLQSDTLTGPTVAHKCQLTSRKPTTQQFLSCCVVGFLDVNWHLWATVLYLWDTATCKWTIVCVEQVQL